MLRVLKINSKVIKLILLIIFTLLLFTSCTNNEAKDISSELQKEINSEMLIDIQVKDKVFSGTLYNTLASQELYEKMPMTINMDEFNGNEKLYYLSERLSTNSQRVGKVNTGDIMLFGSDCLVIFYESFSTPYSYTKLGYIEDVEELKEALGKGSIEITFNKSK